MSEITNLTDLLTRAESPDFSQKPWKYEIVREALKASEANPASLKELAPRISRLSKSDRSSWLGSFFSACLNLVMNGVFESSDALLADISECWKRSERQIHKGAMHRLARMLILSAPYRFSLGGHIAAKKAFEERCESLPDYYTHRFEKISTEDGETLKSCVFQLKGSTPETPTVILFSPNAETVLTDDVVFEFLDVIAKANDPKFRCNFVTFNYRGVEGSTGRFLFGKDLLKDGKAVIKWVRENLYTEPHQIHFYGRSLGGAVAALTHEALPEITGRQVSVCCFSSLAAVIDARAPKWLSGSIKKLIAPYELLAEEASSKIQGKQLIVYYPKDTVIPETARLHANITGVQEIALAHQNGKEEYFLQEGHNVDLAWCQLKGREGAAHTQILSFLLRGRLLRTQEP